MNAKYTLSLLLMATLFVASCKKDLVPQQSSSSSSETLPSTDSTDVATAPAPGVATPAQVQPQMPQNTQMNAVPTPAQPVAKGMNPAHGQPGHRCDIAVGAPLNSPATKPAAPQKISANQPVAVNNNATPAAVTAPGMNPPHGQEGHRCDIAVGAPLSSPKATPTTTPAMLTPAPTATPQQ